MKRFFFDLVGEIRARDFMGHECSSKKEAKSHAAFIAHRIGTERPSFAKVGNFIAVRDERDLCLVSGLEMIGGPEPAPLVSVAFVSGAQWAQSRRKAQEKQHGYERIHSRVVRRFRLECGRRAGRPL
jgi:hypothetical protein